MVERSRHEYNGNIEYEGDFVNDVRHGKGKSYFPSDNMKLEYQGLWENGKRQLNH